jgi:hypothetical protein
MKRRYLILLITILLICVIGLTACEEKPDEPIETYDVVSVYIYEYPITNRMGGVHDVEIRYYFTYLDAEGKLKHEDSFNHSLSYEYVALGDKNQFIINPNDNTRVLYLTKDTMDKLQKVNN